MTSSALQQNSNDADTSNKTDHTAPQTIVRCVGLTKVFRDFWMRSRVKAVNAIDLDIRQGEIFGLLGPNGSGKSTTIKMILGLLHPTSGRIAVFSKHPRDVATKNLIGYLPEESYLYPFLDARETLDYYGRLFHQNHRQRKQRIDMLLSMVGLNKAKRRPIGEYSKGMQRRIGLAQALINDPKLLILDEPTTGLDPIGTKQIKDLIAQLAQRGTSILLCSHLLADVEDVCDRVSIMFGGKIRKAGTVDQLLTKTATTTIEAESLSNQDIEKVEAALQSRGKHIDRVLHPRQRLEDLFLQIVQEAQNEGAYTSGARPGGKIAQFLVTQSDEPGQIQPDELISRLQTPDTPSDADEQDAKTTTIHSQPESKETPSVLDQLTHVPHAKSHTAGSGDSDEEKPEFSDPKTDPKIQPKPSPESSGSSTAALSTDNLKPKIKNPPDEKEDKSVIDSLLKSDNKK